MFHWTWAPVGAVWLVAVPISLYANRRHADWLSHASTDRSNVVSSPVILLASAVLHTRDAMVVMPILTALVSLLAIGWAGLAAWILVSTAAHVLGTLLSIPLIERYERDVAPLREVPDVGSSYFTLGSVALILWSGPTLLAVALCLAMAVITVVECCRLSIWRAAALPEAGDIGHVVAIIVGIVGAALAVR
jgi:hypothetical protein